MKRKIWKLNILAIAIMAVFALVIGGQAAGIWNMGEHTIEAFWKFRGANSELEIGNGVLVDVLSGGEIEIDSGGTLDVNGTLELSTGSVTAAMIANPTRSFSLPLAGAAIDGGDDIDDGSAPDITTLDTVPAILWDDSSETAAVQWTFRLPSDFASGLVVYALVSSNDASGSGTILDWAVAVNADDTAFASPTAQTQVACTSATLDASNEVLTLTSDATAEALYSAGTWITLELFNASTNDDDLELKGVDVAYTATM